MGAFDRLANEASCVGDADVRLFLLVSIIMLFSVPARIYYASTNLPHAFVAQWLSPISTIENKCWSDSVETTVSLVVSNLARSLSFFLFLFEQDGRAPPRRH